MGNHLTRRDDHALAATASTVLPANGGVPIAIGAKMAVLDAQGRLDIFSAVQGPTDPGHSRTTVAAGSTIATATVTYLLVESPLGRPLEITGVTAEGASRSVYKGQSNPSAPVEVRPCYAGPVCVPEGDDLVALDADGDQPSVLWRTKLGFETTGEIAWAGVEYTIVGGRRGGEAVYAVVNGNGRIISTYAAGRRQRLDVVREAVVLGPSANTERSWKMPFVAVNRLGGWGPIGHITGSACSAGDDVVLCLDDIGVTTWSLH